MTLLAKNYDLIPGLPIHFAPTHPFVDVHTLVPQLLDLHPDWALDDLIEFIEEKTRGGIHPEDHITLRAVYQRCLRLRIEFQE